MVLGSIVFFMVLSGQQLDDAALRERARSFEELCFTGWNPISQPLNQIIYSIKDEDDFFPGCKSLQTYYGRVKIDQLSGYIPYAYFTRSPQYQKFDPPRKGTDLQVRRRVEDICEAAGYGGEIRIGSVEYISGREPLATIVFHRVWRNIRYANRHGASIELDLETGRVANVSLGWYPEPPATMPPIRLSIDQARWLAIQKLAAQGDFRPRFESMPTELVITAELGDVPPGFMNKPAYPRPINKPAVRTDVLGVVRYHVIFKTEGDRYQIDHFMFDPTDGRMTWSDRPRSGGGALPVAVKAKPWSPMAKGTIRIASKYGKASINLGKAVQKTVAKGAIVPNCLVLSGNRVLSGQWSAKDRILKVSSAGTVHSIKY